MSHKFLKIHPADNVLVALTDLRAGEEISYNGSSLKLAQDVPAKHKFVLHAMVPEDEVVMYGILVGKTIKPIPAGGVISTQNAKRKSSDFAGKTKTISWTAPDVSRWKDKTFLFRPEKSNSK